MRWKYFDDTYSYYYVIRICLEKRNDQKNAGQAFEYVLPLQYKNIIQNCVDSYKINVVRNINNLHAIYVECVVYKYR